MDITSKLIEGVVDLTKLMAHGAMHEACLIEVLKTTEDEALELVKTIKNCVYENGTLLPDIQSFIDENNATILDIDQRKINVEIDEDNKISVNDKQENVEEMKDLIRRMLADQSTQDLDKHFKKKLVQLQKELGSSKKSLIENKNQLV